MLKALLLKITGNDFVRDCMLFKCNVPYYWFLGVLV